MKRWIVLAFFGLMAAMSQAFWLNYAAMGQLLKTKYGTSDSENVLLMMVFPLLYVLLSQPSGRWIDRRGYVGCTTEAFIGCWPCRRGLPLGSLWW